MNDLMADKKPRFINCPHCAARSLERLRTHCHCANCNYFEDLEVSSMDSLLFSLNKMLDFLESKDAGRDLNKCNTSQV